MEQSPSHIIHSKWSKNFSDEEMIKDWTITEDDKKEVTRYRSNFRLFIAIQICSVRLYGRFLTDVNHLSPRIISYINSQLDLSPSLSINTPNREATFSEQRKNILAYLRFSKYDDKAQLKIKTWLKQQAKQGFLPDNLIERAEQYLLNSKIILPGRSVIERLTVSVCGCS